MANYITDDMMMLKALAFTIESIKAQPKPSRRNKDLLKRSEGVLELRVPDDKERNALLEEARSNLLHD